MHDNAPVGRVTSSTGNLDHEGRIAGALNASCEYARRATSLLIDVLEHAAAGEADRARAKVAIARGNVELAQGAAREARAWAAMQQ